MQITAASAHAKPSDAEVGDEYIRGIEMRICDEIRSCHRTTTTRRVEDFCSFYQTIIRANPFR